MCMMKNLAIAVTYSRPFHFVSIIVDFASISYFVWSFFFLETPIISLEILLGTYLVGEYILLMLASDNYLQYIRHPLAISNILIIIGYLAAPFWNLGILRILRSLRIIQIYQIIPDIRMFTPRLLIWEKVLAMLFHVCVLIFIITEIVFLLQEEINAGINNRFDAFFFTTNAIMKAGTGETIALVGAQGQILTLIIAFLSLSVFVQMLDTVREVQNMHIKKNKQRKTKVKVMQGLKEPKEIYSEHLCTYCDIKNREKIVPKRQMKPQQRRV